MPTFGRFTAKQPFSRLFVQILNGSKAIPQCFPGRGFLLKTAPAPSEARMPNRNFRAKNPIFSKNFRAAVKDSRFFSPIVYMTGNAKCRGAHTPPGDFFPQMVDKSPMRCYCTTIDAFPPASRRKAPQPPADGFARCFASMTNNAHKCTRLARVRVPRNIVPDTVLFHPSCFPWAVPPFPAGRPFLCP